MDLVVLQQLRELDREWREWPRRRFYGTNLEYAPPGMKLWASKAATLLPDLLAAVERAATLEAANEAAYELLDDWLRLGVLPGREHIYAVRDGLRVAAMAALGGVQPQPHTDKAEAK